MSTVTLLCKCSTVSNTVTGVVKPFFIDFYSGRACTDSLSSAETHAHTVVHVTSFVRTAPLKNVAVLSFSQV